MINKTILLLLLLFIAISNPTSAQNIDTQMAININHWNSSFVRNSSRFVSNSVQPLAVILPTTLCIYGALKKDKKMMQDAIYIGSSILEAGVLSYGLKYATNRKRPYEQHSTIHPYDNESTSSFPSSHTAVAFSLATSLSLTYPKWYVILPSTLWACSVGIARINQGVHYPSDVAAGAAIGIGCAFFNITINKWLNKTLLSSIYPPKRHRVNY